jgi:hypothetical protein
MFGQAKDIYLPPESHDVNLMGNGVDAGNGFWILEQRGLRRE